MNVDQILPLKTITGKPNKEFGGWWRHDVVETANGIKLGHIQIRQRPGAKEVEAHTTSYFPTHPVEPDQLGWHGGSVQGAALDWLIRQYCESPKGLDECEARVRAVAVDSVYVVHRPFGLMVGKVGYYEKGYKVTVKALEVEMITLQVYCLHAWDPREWQKRQDGKPYKEPGILDETFQIPQSIFMNLVRNGELIKA